MCHGRRWMPHPQWQDTSEEGRGRKSFVLVSMLLGAIHTGLKQNFKGQFCLLSGSLLAPAFMTLFRQRRGERPLEKNNTKQAVSCCKMKLKADFLLNSFQKRGIFHRSVQKHHLFFWNVPSRWIFLKALILESTLFANNAMTLWMETGVQGSFSPCAGSLSNSPVDTKRKNKQTSKTKYNLEN